MLFMEDMSLPLSPIKISILAEYMNMKTFMNIVHRTAPIRFLATTRRENPRQRVKRFKFSLTNKVLLVLKVAKVSACRYTCINVRYQSSNSICFTLSGNKHTLALSLRSHLAHYKGMECNAQCMDKVSKCRWLH